MNLGLYIAIEPISAHSRESGHSNSVISLYRHLRAATAIAPVLAHPVLDDVVIICIVPWMSTSPARRAAGRAAVISHWK